MGELVEFPSNGATAGGYLAPATEGAGLGVVVVPGWRGLVPHIGDVCDRFASEGFTALAPDLYEGRTVAPGNREEADGAAMALDLEVTGREMSGAVDYLGRHPAVRGAGVGVVGFSTGGGLALWLATLRPDMVRAVVPFYGVVPPDRRPDWSMLEAAVEGHYAEDDDRAGFGVARALEEELTALGKEVRMFLYPGTAAAFFDDTRPEVYDPDAARQAWVRTLEFLRAKLG
ncbi:MAG TPA: dienelactone hydrolase family protein [Acidimicrobiales bacterium]|nr:dienelactone hydrolase family protein [Acidimicrobiales bacterium]